MTRRVANGLGPPPKAPDATTKTDVMLRAERMNRFEEERCSHRLEYLRWQEEASRKAMTERIERFKQIDKSMQFSSGE